MSILDLGQGQFQLKVEVILSYNFQLTVRFRIQIRVKVSLNKIWVSDWPSVPNKGDGQISIRIRVNSKLGSGWNQN